MIRPFRLPQNVPYTHILHTPANERENQAMTIVVGLRCEHGIALCEDERVSAAGAFKIEAL